MGQFAAIVSVIAGAVGAGVQYVTGRSAAATQEQLALLNAQAQTQAVQQQGQVNAMQARINAQLADKDRAAAEANAAMLAQQAESGSRMVRAHALRTREEAARAAAAQRAALAKGGFADVTGSPLALLAETAEREQEAIDALRFDDEQSRRQLFREAALMRNQGILAGIQATGFRAEGSAARNAAAMGASQARLNLYAERTAASAARSQAAGGLFTSFGSLTERAWRLRDLSPWSAKKP